MYCNKGYTFIESIVSISILALLTAMAAPSFIEIKTNIEGKLLTKETQRQLNATRELAITAGKSYILCGTENKKTCIPTAFSYTMIFHDKNKNKRVDGEEVISFLFNRPKVSGTIEWNVNGITFRKDGSARAGSMIFCPQDGDLKKIQRVTVNFAGRVYVAPPKKDGVVRTASGRPVDC